MEKTREIPGWYQRLMSQCTKPASETTFKQYCRENEIKMKTLYPFLPYEQIKGKLFTQWKKGQPQHYDSSLVKTKAKRLIKSFKRPGVLLSSRAGEKNKLSLINKANRIDWLDRDRGEKTYKGRAFVLPTKVPEVIYEYSNMERSILKNRRVCASDSGEKKQTASQVSFTLNEERCHSPAPYSPPTPFVLSPVSDDDQAGEPSSKLQNVLRLSPKTLPHNVTHKSKPQLEYQTSNAENHFETNDCKVFSPNTTSVTTLPLNRTHERQYPSETKRKQFDGPSKSQRSSNFPSKRNVRAKRKRNAKYSPRPKSNDLSKQYEDMVLAMQQTPEPPKFVTQLVESQVDDDDKRFRLFEDECLEPRKCLETQSPRSPRNIPAAPRIKSKRTKLFSWSPTIGCSQQTPRVKKSTKSMFSQEKPVTYHRDRRTVRSLKTKHLSTARKPQRSHLKKSNKRRIRKRSNERKITKHQVSDTLLTLSQVANGSNETISQLDRHNECSETYLMFEDRDRSENSGSANLCSKPACRKMTGAEQLSDDNDFVENSRTHSRRQNDDQKENFINPNNPKKLMKKIKENCNNIGTENSSVKKMIPEKINYRRHSTNSASVNSALKRHPNQPKSVAEPHERKEDRCSHTSSSPTGTDILKQILLQLKNTTASSQNRPMQSSPAQSGITEASEMSMDTLFSCAPSTPMHDDSVDTAHLSPTEKMSWKRTLTAVDEDSVYRKRGNILCNMFDVSSTNSTKYPGTKRSVLSESLVDEDDFSLLLDEDMNV